jgi:hypothetical protein
MVLLFVQMKRPLHTPIPPFLPLSHSTALFLVSSFLRIPPRTVLTWLEAEVASLYEMVCDFTVDFAPGSNANEILWTLRVPASDEILFETLYPCHKSCRSGGFDLRLYNEEVPPSPPRGALSFRLTSVALSCVSDWCST